MIKQRKPDNPGSIILGPVRLGYVHLLEPWAGPAGGDPKYSVRILIPKSDKEMVNGVLKAIKWVRDNSAAKFGGTVPANLVNCLMDGDDAKYADDETCDGHYFINAKSKDKPTVVDKHRNEIWDKEEIYSGMWANVSMDFYAYNNVNKGISAGLGNVQKVRDDESFTGRQSAEQDFDGFMMESEDSNAEPDLTL